MTEPAITPDLIKAHGLSPDEYERILEIIGREPTFTELGIFSAMWNEHCSYKSSKKMAAHPPYRRATSHMRSRRKRRCGRYRRRTGRDFQNGKP